MEGLSKRIPFYTNRIGMAPQAIEPGESEGEAAKVARLITDMVKNGPTDGDSGFWLEPQARELWSVYIGLFVQVRELQDELFEARMTATHSVLSLKRGHRVD